MKRSPRSGPSITPRLRLSVSAGSWKALIPYLKKHLRLAHDVLKPALTDFSIALVGDARMSVLHQQFLGIDGPTDVLTFPLEQNDAGDVSAGEVVVCVPEARRRARGEGTDLRREVLLYSLHGMLHLCGFDDLTPRGFRAMHAEEDRILQEIGVGAVFKSLVNKSNKAIDNRALRSK